MTVVLVAAGLVMGVATVAPTRAAADGGSALSPSVYALSVPGSVLTGASSAGWQAARLASSDTFDWAFTQSEYSAISGTATAAPVAPSTVLTSAEEAAWDGIVGSFEAPAVAPASLLEGTGLAGGAVTGGVAIAGFEVGTFIGADVSHAFGFKDDEVCAQQNDVLTTFASVLDHVDCSVFNNTLDTEAKNLRETPFQLPSTACAAGVCAQLVGEAPYPATQSWLPGAMQFCFLIPDEHSRPTAAVRWMIDGQASNNTNIWAFPHDDGDPYCDSFAQPGYVIGTAYSYAPGTTLPSWRFLLEDYNYNVLGQATHTITAADIARPNPSRTLRCDITTASSNTYSASSAAFTEDDTILPTPVCPTIPPSEIPTSVAIYLVTAGEPDWQLSNTPVSTQYAAWRSTYPECSNGSCLLDLRRTSDSASCLTLTDACDGWISDPTRATDYTCI